MATDTGRSPNGSGHSSETEPSCTVSAQSVSVPNAFTPGPWTRRDTETHAEIDAPGQATLAMVVKAEDADLIASAPVMYEALREISLYAFAPGDDMSCIRLTLLSIESVADAALAKARGER